MLDIGHATQAAGARAPSAVNGTRLEEVQFWYEYSYYTKRVIERAGYKCAVSNRGNMPSDAEMRRYAKRSGVVHLKKPGAGLGRYPSRYHPDRVSGGMVSADYAIWSKASCAVFLHLNSSSSRWVSGGSQGLLVYNKYNGRQLAECLKTRMEEDILDEPNGMPNGGRGISLQQRSVDAGRGAGWMNACDDSGIPAAIIEVAFVNNRNHANYLTKHKNAVAYAESVGQGIVDYMRRYGSAPRHIRKDENRGDEGSFGYAAESRRLRVKGAKLLH